MLTLAQPSGFLNSTQRLLPWLAWLCAACFAAGLWFALVRSPADYQQGDAVRIMYVHVPAAWMSLSVYLFMAAASAAFLVRRLPLMDVLARSAAPLGAGFTLMTLITGSLWGKPMWGAWWVWDARLTSVLVLFFLYLGYMALASAGSEGGGQERTAKACAVLALIGCANLPIIKFSVEWWNTLHQPASLIRSGGVAIDGAMLPPLLLMTAAYMLFFAGLVVVRARTSLLLHKIRRLQTRGR